GTRVCHQLRRDAGDLFTRAEQVPLQTARKVPAVFDCPSACAETSHPSNELEMISRRRADRPRRELTPLLIDRDGCVTALVRVDPDGHHARCLSFCSKGEITPGRPAGIS